MKRESILGWNPIELRRHLAFIRAGSRSKYMPHQGIEECRRRRERMGTGEYRTDNTQRQRT